MQDTPQWLRYRYRIYPTVPQQRLLAQAFGCARVVYNDALAARDSAYMAGEPYPTDAELSAAMTASKATPERAFLKDAPSVVLQQSLADLNAAYRHFFASVAGKRPGCLVGHPKLKRRRDRRQSLRFTRNANFRVTADGRLRLPKIGEVKVRWSRSLPSEPSSVSVIMDSAGRYFASFVVMVSTDPLQMAEPEVGIDLGLTHYAVMSDGRKIANPRFLRRAERKLRKAHQAVSRKIKGSSNRDKARRRLARQYAKVADTRRDWLHKESTRIIRENQAVYVENLCISAIARTRLSKSVRDAGWGMFVSMLEYKADLYGRGFGRLGRFQPTSQICSACGLKDGKKALSVREWTCSGCGAVHDRDVNAARNILAAGRAERQNACGGTVRPGLAPAGPSETGTIRSVA